MNRRTDRLKTLPSCKLCKRTTKITRYVCLDAMRGDPFTRPVSLQRNGLKIIKSAKFIDPQQTDVKILFQFRKVMSKETLVGKYIVVLVQTLQRCWSLLLRREIESVTHKFSFCLCLGTGE